MFAKFYEIPSLPFQDTESLFKILKNQNVADRQMDGCENNIPPTNTVCGVFVGAIKMNKIRTQA